MKIRKAFCFFNRVCYFVNIFLRNGILCLELFLILWHIVFRWQSGAIGHESNAGKEAVCWLAYLLANYHPMSPAGTVVHSIPLHYSL